MTSQHFQFHAAQSKLLLVIIFNKQRSEFRVIEAQGNLPSGDKKYLLQALKYHTQVLGEQWHMAAIHSSFLRH